MTYPVPSMAFSQLARIRNVITSVGRSSFPNLSIQSGFFAAFIVYDRPRGEITARQVSRGFLSRKCTQRAKKELLEGLQAASYPTTQDGLSAVP